MSDQVISLKFMTGIKNAIIDGAPEQDWSAQYTLYTPESNSFQRENNNGLQFFIGSQEVSSSSSTNQTLFGYVTIFYVNILGKSHLYGKTRRVTNQNCNAFVGGVCLDQCKAPGSCKSRCDYCKNKAAVVAKFDDIQVADYGNHTLRAFGSF